MKKNLFHLLIVFFALGIMSCKDDDNNDVPNPDYSSTIAGTYKGDLDVTLANAPTISNGQNISITKTDENHIELSIKDFTFQGLNVGDIVIKDVEVSNSNDTYTLSPIETKLTLKVPVGTVKVSLTSATIKDKDMKLKINVLQESISLNIAVDFSGVKLNGTEKGDAELLSFQIDSSMVTAITTDKDTVFININNFDPAKGIKLTPTIEVSEKAKIYPSSGIEQNFANPVIYTVVAENGTRHEYVVKYKMGEYDFENWIDMPGNIPDMQDDIFIPYKEASGWSSSNTGVRYIKMFDHLGIPAEEYVISRGTDAKSGSYAPKITTMNTIGMESLAPGAFPAIPKVTTGSLFLGSFETDAINTLRSTRFGIEYHHKPISVSGFYKYTPGEIYYRCDDIAAANNVVEDNTKTDQCMLSAVLYEVNSFDLPEGPNDPDERLNGTNIYDSEKIVAIATMPSGKQENFTPFTLTLEYKQTYDPQKLYRFAVIFSSSIDGDKFSGAPGSTLIVDDVKIVNE